MLASDLIKRYERFCPPELSVEGDISGLQIGSLHQPIKKVMVALDIREQTVEEAIEKNIDLIIVKHAPIFKPLENLISDDVQTQIYLTLVKHDIAVYVSHTNIDVVKGGLNDWFCQALGLTNVEGLKKTSEEESIGRIGNLPELSLQELGHKLKDIFNLESLRLVTYGLPEKQLVSKIAICGGSAQGFYETALVKGADVFITGDIYYHTAQEMLTRGLLAIDPGHHIEVLFVEKVAALLKEWQLEDSWPIEILASQSLTDPFRYL